VVFRDNSAQAALSLKYSVNRALIELNEHCWYFGITVPKDYCVNRALIELNRATIEPY
jgi:hypothetical protein